MFQPFEKYKQPFTKGLLQLNKLYLVSQTYARAPSISGKINILLTDYDDIGLANIHLAAVKADKYASVIHLENPKHIGVLHSMLDSDSIYIVYWAVVPDKKLFKTTVELKYKNQIRRWILQNTSWKLAANYTLHPVMQVIFGELFVTLSFGSEEIRIKFEEIEKA